MHDYIDTQIYLADWSKGFEHFLSNFCNRFSKEHFRLIEYMSSAQRQGAIDSLHGTELDGHKLTVFKVQNKFLLFFRMVPAFFASTRNKVFLVSRESTDTRAFFGINLDPRMFQTNFNHSVDAAAIVFLGLNLSLQGLELLIPSLSLINLNLNTNPQSQPNEPRSQQ